MNKPRAISSIIVSAIRGNIIVNITEIIIPMNTVTSSIKLIKVLRVPAENVVDAALTVALDILDDELDINASVKDIIKPCHGSTVESVIEYALITDMTGFRTT